jgi:hypothetical protein
MKIIDVLQLSAVFSSLSHIFFISRAIDLHMIRNEDLKISLCKNVLLARQ